MGSKVFSKACHFSERWDLRAGLLNVSSKNFKNFSVEVTHHGDFHNLNVTVSERSLSSESGLVFSQLGMAGVLLIDACHLSL